MTFVKSASTSVPVSRSQGELEKVLRRYGCAGFGVQNDYENQKVSVTFRVPDSPVKDALLIPVRLELDIRAVYDAMYGRPMKPRQWNRERQEYEPQEWNPKGYDATCLQQAERVAWRQLILWVDAACSAASSGVQKMSEAFFAHTVVRGDNGQLIRVIDLADGLSSGGWRALLPAGTAPRQQGESP